MEDKRTAKEESTSTTNHKVHRSASPRTGCGEIHGSPLLQLDELYINISKNEGRNCLISFLS